jgi:hypothetical protein
MVKLECGMVYQVVGEWITCTDWLDWNLLESTGIRVIVEHHFISWYHLWIYQVCLVWSTNNEHIVLVYQYWTMTLSTCWFILKSVFYLCEFIGCSIKLIHRLNNSVILINSTIKISLMLAITYRIVNPTHWWSKLLKPNRVESPLLKVYYLKWGLISVWYIWEHVKSIIDNNRSRVCTPINMIIVRIACLFLTPLYPSHLVLIAISLQLEYYKSLSFLGFQAFLILLKLMWRRENPN